MSGWVRLDSDYFSNPRAVAIGRDGRALHLASICWSGLHEEDGIVPSSVVGKVLLGQAEVTRKAVDKLVDEGLWIPQGNCYEIKNFLKLNPSSAQISRQRELWRLRQSERRSPDS